MLLQLGRLGVELRAQYSCVINSTLPWQPNSTCQHGVGKVAYSAIRWNFAIVQNEGNS